MEIKRNNFLVCIDAVGIRGHGAEAVLCELLHWLPEIRPEWKWHVFILERSLREFDDPVVVPQVEIEHTKCGNNGMSRLGWVNSKLQKRVLEIGADMIFSFANIGARWPLAPQVVMVQQRNAFFKDCMAQGDLLSRLRMYLLRRQILAGAKASSALIVQTESLRIRIEQYDSRFKGRIHVIPGGYRTPSTMTLLRPDIKLLIDKATRPRLIYVSHPSTHKNHLSLLKAWELIHMKYPTASLLLTLQPKYYNTKKKTERLYDSFLKPILDYHESMKKPNKIIFLGFINYDEVQYALSNSDLMVFPSLSESFGLGLVESMNAGCPIIAADLPYAHDVVADAALYFDPNDSHSIEQTVDKVLQSDNMRQRLINSGKERLFIYTYAKISEKIAQVFEDAIKHG